MIPETKQSATRFTPGQRVRVSALADSYLRGHYVRIEGPAYVSAYGIQQYYVLLERRVQWFDLTFEPVGSDASRHHLASERELTLAPLEDTPRGLWRFTHANLRTCLVYTCEETPTFFVGRGSDLNDGYAACPAHLARAHRNVVLDEHDIPHSPPTLIYHILDLTDAQQQAGYVACQRFGCPVPVTPSDDHYHCPNCTSLHITNAYLSGHRCAPDEEIR